ncbi:hypothetical protein [Puniceibacterium confluentis]|uniref:hypothetical protein n=1 Tax=Puniceibacterium confluentis TaxID=1958944 RepID=UPI0011B41B2B|nr:hypothetical protein [Puniceibacterium confluentis]
MNAWTDWLAATDQRQKIDTLVLVSAAGPDVLGPVLSSRAARIALVDANPGQRDALQQEMARDPRLSLTPVAVAGTEGTAPFHSLSLAGLSGLCPPRDLLQLFPGLRQTGATEVPTAPLEQVLRRIGLPTGGCHVLRLDMPGDSATAARQIADLPQDLAVEHVFLRTALSGLYGDAGAAEPVLAALEARGYSLEATLTDDPDFPEYWLHRDPARLRCILLEGELAGLRQRLADSEAEQRRAQEALEAKQSRIEDQARALSDSEERLTALDAQARTAEAALEQARAALAPLEAQVAALTTERDSARTEAAKLPDLAAKMRESEVERQRRGARINDMTAAQEKAEAEARSQKDRIAALETRLRDTDARTDRGEARVSELEQSLSSVRSQAESAEKTATGVTAERDAARIAVARAQEKISALEDRVSQAEKLREQKQGLITQMEQTQQKLRSDSAEIHTRAQQEVSMAVRLQTLDREDLLDLRRRHNQLLADKAAQDSLLRSVTARLQQAARYLQQLDPAEALPGEAPDPLAAPAVPAAAPEETGPQTAGPADAATPGAGTTEAAPTRPRRRAAAKTAGTGKAPAPRRSPAGGKKKAPK